MRASDPTGPAKTLPAITEENRPFWDAARQRRLVMQRCTACGHIRYPIQALCPGCLSDQLEWTEISGRGTVLAVVVYHQAFNAAWKSDVPYNVVLVQLEEGPRMYGNVTGAAGNAVQVGDPVRAVFMPVSDDVVVPRFERAGS